MSYTGVVIEESLRAAEPDPTSIASAKRLPDLPCAGGPAPRRFS